MYAPKKSAAKPEFCEIIEIKRIRTGSGSDGSSLEDCVQLSMHCLSNDAASCKLGYTIHRQKDPGIHESQRKDTVQHSLEI